MAEEAISHGKFTMVNTTHKLLGHGFSAVGKNQGFCPTQPSATNGQQQQAASLHQTCNDNAFLMGLTLHVFIIMV